VFDKGPRCSRHPDGSPGHACLLSPARPRSKKDPLVGDGCGAGFVRAWSRAVVLADIQPRTDVFALHDFRAGDRSRARHNDQESHRQSALFLRDFGDWLSALDIVAWLAVAPRPLAAIGPRATGRLDDAQRLGPADLCSLLADAREVAGLHSASVPGLVRHGGA